MLLYTFNIYATLCVSHHIFGTCIVFLLMSIKYTFIKAHRSITISKDKHVSAQLMWFRILGKTSMFCICYFLFPLTVNVVLSSIMHCYGHSSGWADNNQHISAVPGERLIVYSRIYLKSSLKHEIRPQYVNNTLEIYFNSSFYLVLIYALV